MTSNLRFPLPPGCSEPPVWTAKGFLTLQTPPGSGVVRAAILSLISRITNGTGVQEKVAGDDHYIEQGSPGLILPSELSCKLGQPPPDYRRTSAALPGSFATALPAQQVTNTLLLGG